MSKHFLWALACCLFMVGCSDDDLPAGAYDPSQPVVFTDFTPKTGALRTRLYIQGSNFGTDVSKIHVSVGGVDAKVIGSNGTEIYCMVLARSYESTNEITIDGKEYYPGTIKVTIDGADGQPAAEYSFENPFGYEAKQVVGTLIRNVDEDGVAGWTFGPFETASVPSNDGTVTKQQERFMKKLNYFEDKGKPVAVADIAYGNGADNALVKELFAHNKAYSVAAYGGWNTAGNTIGFALSQGLLAPDMTEAGRDNLLNIRYLDDWAYQANVRMKVSAELIWPNHWPNSGLNSEQLVAAENLITKEIKNIASPLMTEETVDGYQFNLPWQRMFEVRVAQK